MNLWGMGTGEILLILIVALLIWGPGRITEIGRKLGKMTRTLKKTTFDLTTQINKETEQQEKKPPPQDKSGN